MESEKKKPPRVDDELPSEEAWERFERAVDVVIKSGPQHKMNDAKKGQSARGVSKTAGANRPKET
jgi:hypothetical protein